VPGAECPLPAAHHYGLPAGVKAGVGERAADHHAGFSVDTILMASSCRATERPSWTLRLCLRVPTASGQALERGGAVHGANIAFATTFSAPWSPPQV